MINLSAEELSTVSLAEVKQMIEEQVPDAFVKKRLRKPRYPKAPTKGSDQKALRKIDGIIIYLEIQVLFIHY